MSADRLQALDRLYSLLSEVEARCGGKRLLANATGRSGWPNRGVYFFFEDGELREDGVTPRVTRVGTHALRPSQSTLWKRLSQHQGTPTGSMAGGGNHRGSIFRLHVGACLLAASGRQSPTWGRRSSAPRDVRLAELEHEREVSAYIGRMPFLWLEVDDEPSAESKRGVIEAGAIALLSNYRRSPIDAASSAWLGRHSTRERVAQSGLWNVNHVDELASDAFLAVIERHA